jgi:ligand-binding SRPBCC domain-containing protein
MAMTLEAQWHLATDNPAFRGKVTSALTKAAISAFVATANADAVVQAKRIQMAGEVLTAPAVRVQQFCWIVVTSAGFPDDPAQVTDATITGVITTGLFDIAANALIPTPVVAP